MKNIVLIGFMGSGKTAMGRFLSQEMDYNFYDTDSEIEAVTGMKIDRLIHKYGKIRFNSEEKLVLTKLGAMDNAIIATGGSFICNEDNIKILKEKGVFVFLKADEQAIIERLSRRKVKPFKEKGSLEELVPLHYGEMLPLYEKYSDLTVETGNQTMEETAAQIKKYLDF